LELRGRRDAEKQQAWVKGKKKGDRCGEVKQKGGEKSFETRVRKEEGALVKSFGGSGQRKASEYGRR